MPASDASTSSTQRVREPMQELDDVVFVDERVGELDERRCRSLVPGPCASAPFRRCRCTRSVRHGFQRSGESKRRRPAATSAATSLIGRSCAKAYARSRHERIGERDAGLHRDPSRRLVHLHAGGSGPARAARRRFPAGRRPASRAGCGSPIGHHDRVVDLIVGRARPTGRGTGSARRCRSGRRAAGNRRRRESPAARAPRRNSGHRSMLSSARSGSKTGALRAIGGRRTGPRPSVYSTCSTASVTAIGNADAAKRPPAGHQHQPGARDAQDIGAREAQGTGRIMVRFRARGDDLRELLRLESADRHVYLR